MKLLVVMPAYNEATIISKTLSELIPHLKNYNAEVIVIDDGSSDDTSSEARKVGVTVLRHVINRGLGGALGTGLAYAKKNQFDAAVTIDADGQHDPRDIKKVLAPLKSNNADVVIGTRTQTNWEEIPIDRKILLWGGNFVTQALFGQTTSDSQSGFRAFNKEAIDSIIVKTDRMEVSSELFSEIRRLKLRLAEVPIKVIYTSYSRAKGQKNSNAINILFKLVLRLFR